METKAIESAASEISSWIQDAVSDMAYGKAEFQDEETKKKFTKAKRKGVTDLHGWYAEELYNDVDTLRDLTGDRIYDAAEGNMDKKFSNMILIAEAMKDSGHKALTIALKRHIRDWKKTVARVAEIKI